MAEAERYDKLDVDDPRALANFVKTSLVNLVRSAKDDKVKLGTLIELGEFVRLEGESPPRPKQHVQLGDSRDSRVNSPTPASSLRDSIEARKRAREEASDSASDPTPGGL
jgi:hypothetical protein